ncbi:MAG: hypothetical protein ACKO81_16440 [Planctomycetota bacterium]
MFKRWLGIRPMPKHTSSRKMKFRIAGKGEETATASFYMEDS